MSRHDEERAMERLYDRPAPSGKPMSEFDAVFWFEVKSPNATTRSIAICYALLMASTPAIHPAAWRKVNDGVMVHHGGAAGLRKVKRDAWEIYTGVSQINEPQP